jgi:hypothetical protein
MWDGDQHRIDTSPRSIAHQGTNQGCHFHNGPTDQHLRAQRQHSIQPQHAWPGIHHGCYAEHARGTDPGQIEPAGHRGFSQRPCASWAALWLSE